MMQNEPKWSVNSVNGMLRVHTCAACCFGQGALLPARPNADVAWLEFGIRLSGWWKGLLNTSCDNGQSPIHDYETGILTGTSSLRTENFETY